MPVERLNVGQADEEQFHIREGYVPNAVLSRSNTPRRTIEDLQRLWVLDEQVREAVIDR